MTTPSTDANAGLGTLAWLAVVSLSLLIASGLLAYGFLPSMAKDAQQPSEAGDGADDQQLVRQRAAAVYAQRCAACHGTTGAGDGPVAETLDPPPAPFTTQAWQDSISDAAIDEIIVAGGAAVDKSALMPAAPDLGRDPELLVALRDLIRSMGPASE